MEGGHQQSSLWNSVTTGIPIKIDPMFRKYVQGLFLFCQNGEYIQELIDFSKLQ
jgi:hypothetical protein